MSKRSFTLLEILIAVVIIGILATFGIPRYQKAVERTRFVQVRITIKALAAAERLYYAEHGSYYLFAWTHGDFPSGNGPTLAYVNSKLGSDVQKDALFVYSTGNSHADPGLELNGYRKGGMFEGTYIYHNLQTSNWYIKYPGETVQPW